MDEIEKLEQGIAALEQQRGVLGDAVVDAMLSPVRDRLAALRSALVGSTERREQRKQVTVLFADLAGFTALSESLDAEDTRQQINRLWARLDQIIADHGGWVDKHMGDEVMALWGVEIAREDDPERAIRAALAMQSNLADFQGEVSFDLTMRIGINTGPVMLGTIGSMAEFTAMGDTVNLASRLQDAAPLGRVLISHDTYRQVRGVFDVLPQPPLAVKGKRELQQTYVVMQIKPRAFRLRTRGVEGIETCMVGRKIELDQLKVAFERVAAGQGLQLVMVVGEAGVGKSRLLYEFQNWLDLLPTFIHIFKGRATEAMQNLPFALLRDVFAYRFEISDSAPQSVARQKLEQGIIDFMRPEGASPDPDVIMMAHFIGHLIGLDYSASEHLRGILDDPQQIRRRAFHYLAQFFRAVSRREGVGATVLLLDDLHWADDGSLDALSTLVQEGRSLPLLIIGLARPTMFERRPAWTSALRLEIEPLSEAESHQLVEEILQKAPEVPQELRNLIVSGSEGNPFYLEELIKMLIDRKVILPGDDAWRIEIERLATVRVPPTLTGVLQARLDHLPVDENDVLQRAAVIGRVFWDRAVAALDQGTVPALEPILESLNRRELIFERGVSAFDGAREYIFKHAILREVTYETVLKRLRRVYHARAAAWLIEIGGDRSVEYAGLIAGHFEQAGEATQAVAWYSQAGEAAQARSAFNSAVSYYSQALALTSSSDPAYPNLARQKGETYMRLGEIPAARQALQDAVASASDITAQAAALATLAELLSESGDYAGAADLLDQALPLARRCQDRVTLTRALFALGSIQWRLGNLHDSQTAFDECLALARALGDVTRELFALNRLGAVALTFGRLAEAERLWGEVYQRALAVGNRERAMASVNNLGSVANTRQDFSAARKYILEALRLSREIGAQHTEALALINLGEIDINLGKHAEARTELRQGLALALHQGTMPRVLGAVVFFAELAYAEGQAARSLALWGLAKRQPAWNAELQRALDIALAAWKLDPAVVDAGLAQGAALDWEATLQELLAAED